MVHCFRHLTSTHARSVLCDRVLDMIQSHLFIYIIVRVNKAYSRFEATGPHRGVTSAVSFIPYPYFQMVSKNRTVP